MKGKLLPLLDAAPNIQILLITPRWWIEGGIKVYGRNTNLRSNSSTAYVCVMPTLLTGMQFAHFYPSLHWLMLHWKPDIVHAEEEPISLSCAHASLLCRLLLSHARFIFFTWENIHQPWSPPNLRAFVYPALERISFANASLAIAGTEMAMRTLEKRGFKKPVIVCPQFGVDVELFRPMPQAQRESIRKRLGLDGSRQSFIVGYIGRLVPEKGVDMLIKIASMLDWVKVIIVGDGPMRTALEESANKLGLQSRTRLFGAIPHERLHEILNALDALVLPSRSLPHWKEQFGRVLVEAMACGIPVIGSSSGAIPEVVGDAGLIFAEGNADELCSCILCLASNDDLRVELSRRGRKRAVEQFSNGVIAQKMLMAYESAARCNKL